MADSVEFDPRPDAVNEVRRLVRARLAGGGRADLEDDAVLVAAELATNALFHGRGPITVSVSTTTGGPVRIEVADRSPVPPRVGPHRELGTTGRGLTVVTALATVWGCELTPDGKVVWAELGGETRADEIDLRTLGSDQGVPSAGNIEAAVG
ncbi:MAG TPA: ATP-binding protein [Acidimicrobiales bacterium]|nr:ATP-binding protein [Acidimicrobiales bacterium]